MTLNPTDFCASSDVREYLQTPFNLLGHTIATNNHIMLVSPIDDQYPQLAMAGIGRESFVETLKKHLKSIQGAHYTPPPPVIYPDKKDCPECQATGKASITTCVECQGQGEIDLETEYNTYNVSCLSCYGEGEFITLINDSKDCPRCQGAGQRYPAHSTANIRNLSIAVNYLQMIINAPGLQVAIDKDKQCLFFKTGNQSGAIMGVGE